jgi:hypothetical protein
LGLCGADLREPYIAGEKKNKSEHGKCGTTLHLASSGEWSLTNVRSNNCLKTTVMRTIRGIPIPERVIVLQQKQMSRI